MELVEEKLNNIGNKFKINEKLAFITVLIIGLFSHAFTFFNHVFFGDGIEYINTLGSTLQSGRWGLEVLYRLNLHLLGNNSIPVINGVLSILLIGIIAVIVIRTLKIESKLLSVILAALMVSFPVVAGLFIYIFTAPAYFLSVLLNVYAIYLFDKHRNIISFIISILLITFSLGIYQAFLSISAAFALFVLLREIIENEKSTKDIIILGIKFLIILITALILYFILHKLSISLIKIQMSTHNGLNEIGKMEISKLPRQINKAYGDFFKFDWFNINRIDFVKKAIVYSYYLSILFAITSLINKQIKLDKKLLFILVNVLLPLAINVIYLFSTADDYKVEIQSSYSLVFLFIYNIYLLDKIKLPYLEKTKFVYFANILTLSTLIISYIYIDNASYFRLYSENRKLESVYANITSRIQSLPGYRTDMKILYLGQNETNIPLSEVGLKMIFPYKYDYYKANNIMHIYSQKKQMAFYTGFYHEPYVDEDEKITNSEEVSNMPSYPNDGSIKIIDDVIVVKYK